MHRIVAVLASLAAPAVALAYGEPVNGFPSWEERVLHEWSNRARCDPVAELRACPGCADKTCYSPMPALAWHDGAGRAARFHSDEMRVQGWFDTTGYSKCNVVSDINWRYPDSCDASAACACAGGVLACTGACTQWNARTALFGATGAVEVVGTGYADPDAMFHGWMWAATSYTSCSPIGGNQMRWRILTATAPRLGTGMSGTLATMDFTFGENAIWVPSGAHYPRQGATVEAWANWDAPDGPTAAGVIVDGACAPLTLQRGTQTNGAWRAVLTGLETGCHRYVFVFRDHAGAIVTYPTTGSLGIGDASCPDFSTERPAVDGAVCGALPACGADPAGCYDGDPCTVDACTNGVCTHTPAADGASCSDGNACNGSETCLAGACKAGTQLICADTNPCTAHACDAAFGCVTTNVPDGTSCADSTVCDGQETCQAGRCVEGTRLSCDDGNPCTADGCSATAGCTHAVVSNGASCDDGDPCNGAETCQAGTCTAGTPLSCDDGDPCTADACDATTGCAHFAVADGAACSDGDACTGADTCQSGLCTPGAAISCDDGNPCTVDACDVAAGCTHAAASAATECSDGQDCNGPEHCDGAGACAPGTTCQGATPSAPSSSGCGSGGGSGGSVLVLALAALAAWAPRARRRRG